MEDNRQNVDHQPQHSHPSNQDYSDERSMPYVTDQARLDDRNFDATDGNEPSLLDDGSSNHFMDLASQSASSVEPSADAYPAPTLNTQGPLRYNNFGDFSQFPAATSQQSTTSMLLPGYDNGQQSHNFQYYPARSPSTLQYAAYPQPFNPSQGYTQLLPREQYGTSSNVLGQQQGHVYTPGYGIQYPDPSLYQSTNAQYNIASNALVSQGHASEPLQTGGQVNRYGLEDQDDVFGDVEREPVVVTRDETRKARRSFKSASKALSKGKGRAARAATDEDEGDGRDDKESVISETPTEFKYDFADRRGFAGNYSGRFENLVAAESFVQNRKKLEIEGDDWAEVENDPGATASLFIQALDCPPGAPTRDHDAPEDQAKWWQWQNGADEKLQKMLQADEEGKLAEAAALNLVRALLTTRKEGILGDFYSVKRASYKPDLESKTSEVVSQMVKVMMRYKPVCLEVVKGENLDKFITSPKYYIREKVNNVWNNFRRTHERLRITAKAGEQPKTPGKGKGKAAATGSGDHRDVGKTKSPRKRTKTIPKRKKVAPENEVDIESTTPRKTRLRAASTKGKAATTAPTTLEGSKKRISSNLLAYPPDYGDEEAFGDGSEESDDGTSDITELSLNSEDMP